MKKKMFFALFALAAVLTFSACEAQAESIPYPDGIGPFTSAETPYVSYGEQGVTFEGPYFVTSVGQSADVSMMSALLKRLGTNYVYNTVATADDVVKSGAKTVIISAGMSTKGLGAAGISLEDEQARSQALLKACADNNLAVIFSHLGGTARRGPLSDEFADIVLAQAKYLLIVEEGNKDGKFSDFAKANGLPIAITAKIANCMVPLEAIIK